MRLLAVLFLALTSCTTAPTSTQPRWTAAKVIGLHLDLIDPVRVEQFWFSKQHHYVAATVGSRDVVTGPVWYWRIRDGRLQIYSESQLEEDITFISMDCKTIIAHRS